MEKNSYLKDTHSLTMTNWIYHEKQESSLCGQHCLNNLLQGPYFSADMLADIAQELDQMEQQYMLEAGSETEQALRYLAEDSGNVDDAGNFSIEVLRTAVGRSHGVGLESWTATDMRSAVEDPTVADGFVCNRHDHWFAIRRIRGKFWNLNSVDEKPTPIGDFFLSAFLAQLRADGYSVFVATGNLPVAPKSPIYGGTGRWHKDAELLGTLSESEAKASRDPFAELGEARRLEGSVSTSSKEAEDEQLMLAQALSMVGSQQHEGMVDADMDPELAMALAMSMADQAPDAKRAVTIPEEPAASDSSAISLQLRLPNSEKVMRRFSKHDRTNVLKAVIEQKLRAGERFECIVAGRRMNFEDADRTFAESGIETNTTVTVRIV